LIRFDAGVIIGIGILLVIYLIAQLIF